jgi:hypothetical protein
MFLQIMPTDTVQEATASSTVFFIIVGGIFFIGSLSFFLLSRKTKK